MNNKNFQDLTLEELTTTHGGGGLITKLLAELGTAASNFVNGFVTATKELAETSYNAGYQLGNWLSK